VNPILLALLYSVDAVKNIFLGALVT
jgi:hypothetical protein